MPSPFSQRTSFRFRVADDGPVRLEVYDLRGRRLRVIEERAAAGERRAVSWSGHDDRGSAVASGTYIVRLVTRTGTVTTRVGLVR
jgi:hypothetical protein